MGALIRNKKGIFFTMLAIVLLSLFMLSVTLIPGVFQGRDARNRVESLDKFVIAVEEDLSRQLFISGFRTIFLMEQDIISSVSPIFGVDSVFQEAFFNGTYNGIDQELLEGTSFDEIMEALRDRGKRINANVSFYNPSLEVRQDDPWNVKIILSGNLVIEDFAGLALWNKSSSYEGIVSVSNFDDPLYLLESNGMMLNKVIEGNISDLNDHLDNSYYIASNTGPSFLDRFSGGTGSNVNGIESLVNLQELSQHIPAKNGISVVDYLYFGNEDAGCAVIGGYPSWFRLDDGHLGIYGVGC